METLAELAAHLHGTRAKTKRAPRLPKTPLQAALDAAMLGFRCAFDGRGVQNTRGVEWDHYRWNTILLFEGRSMRVPYQCGIGHVDRAGRPAPPTSADVVRTILWELDAIDTTFSLWASDRGLDRDSFTDLQTYLSSQDRATALQRLLGAPLCEALRDLEH